MLAVSPETLGPAQAYVERQGWEVEVGVVEPTSSGSLAKALTGRTPWVFITDGNGVIIAEGHGERLEELTSRGEPGLGEVPEP